MSDQTSPSNRLNGRSFMSRGVAIYFGILFVLTFIAFTPDAITIGVLIFVLPGLILIASGTLLYYSIALLPAYFINRHLGKRLLAAAVAAISVTAAALLPHYINGYLLGRLVASDHSDPPTSFLPQSFELPYQDEDIYWTKWRGSPGNWPPPSCAYLCQQLLFKGNVDQVVIREHSNPLSDATIDWKKSKRYQVNRDGWREIPISIQSNQSHPFKLKVWRFRLQRREACPETLSTIKGEFVHEVLGGRCLIEDTIDSADADVVLSISETPIAYRTYQNRLRIDPCQGIALSRIENGPTTVTIAERRRDRVIAVETKTTLVAQYATMPFYLSATASGRSVLGSCLVVVREQFPSSFADPFEMIGGRYRLPIAKTPGSNRP